MSLAAVRTVVGAALLAVGLAGCTPTGSSSPAASATPTSGPGSSAAGVGSSVEPGTSSDPVSEYKVALDFGGASGEVSVAHPIIAPPLRTLVGIYVGNHPEGTPAYQRMSFYFRGGYPSYQVKYVASVLTEGAGTPLSLTGNAVLRVGFTDAQAHNDAGGSSIVAAPAAAIGLPNLKSYASAGDFEGHVTYGLGIQVTGGSSLPLRVGELKKHDGTGGFAYVIFVDVRTA